LAVRFEWDEAKNRTNREKHGVGFEEVVPLFATDYAMKYDADHSGVGEDRFVAVGPVGDRLLFVAFTEPSPETIRIITAREAGAHDADFYRAYKEGVAP
jgi:uncharacterized DUF497 family protein